MAFQALQSPNLRPPNTEGDRAPAAHLAIKFIPVGRGGSKNTKARPALRSAGFPETFRATGNSLPAADRHGDGNRRRRLTLSLSLSRKMRRVKLALIFYSCGLEATLRRGHIWNLRLECLWNVSGSAEPPGVKGGGGTQRGTF